MYYYMTGSDGIPKMGPYGPVSITVSGSNVYSNEETLTGSISSNGQISFRWICPAANFRGEHSGLWKGSEVSANKITGWGYCDGWEGPRMKWSMEKIGGGVQAPTPPKPKPQQEPESLNDLACSFGQGTISNSQFLSGVQQLLDSGELVLTGISSQEKYEHGTSIPNWINTGAGWWCSGTISYSDFEAGLIHLANNGYFEIGAETSQTGSSITTMEQPLQWGDSLEICGEKSSRGFTSPISGFIFYENHEVDNFEMHELPGQAWCYFVDIDSNWSPGNYEVVVDDGNASQQIYFTVEGSQITEPEPTSIGDPWEYAKDVWREIERQDNPFCDGCEAWDKLQSSYDEVGLGACDYASTYGYQVTCLEAILKLDPIKNKPVLNWMVQNAIDNHEWDDAVEYYNKFAKEFPEDDGLWDFRQQFPKLYKEKILIEKEKTEQLVQEKGKKIMELHSQVDQLFKQKKYGEAVSVLEEIIQLATDPDPGIFVIKGIMEAKNGERDKAIESLRQAVERGFNPYSADGAALSQVLRDLGEKRLVHEMADKFVEMHPETGFSRFLIGLIHEEAGNYEDAIRNYKLAAKTCPQGCPEFNAMIKSLESKLKSQSQPTTTVTTSSGTAKEVTLDMPIKKGDKITTKNQNFQFKLQNHKIDVGKNSEITIEKQSFDNFVVNISKGTFKWHSDELSKCVECKVKVGHATVNVKGTDFIANYDPVSKISTIHLYDGTIEVHTGTGITKTFTASNGYDARKITVHESGKIEFQSIAYYDWNLLVDEIEETSTQLALPEKELEPIENPITQFIQAEAAAQLETQPDTTDSGDSIQSFQNEEYGLAFNYPNTWNVEEFYEPGPDGALVVIVHPPPSSGASLAFQSLEVDTAGLSDEQYVEQMIEKELSICIPSPCSGFVLAEKGTEIINNFKQHGITYNDVNPEYNDFTMIKETIRGNEKLQMIATQPFGDPETMNLMLITDSVEISDKIDLAIVQEDTIITPDSEEKGGGCLIATATFGTELAPQVQQLRELRDNTLLQTNSGSSFMTGFNAFYYSFSPAIADLERQSPIFKEVVKVAITPLITSLSLLNYVEIDSDQDVLGYGIGIILLNIGMYFVVPAIIILKIRSKLN